MKPRLLLLCQTLPYPPDGGVKIRTYNVLRLLAREFDVTALCFYRTADTGDEFVPQALAGLAPFARAEAFPIPQEHSRLRLVVDHLRSLLSRRAYTVTAYESAKFRRRLVELLASEDFDLAHMDSMDLAGYIAALRNVPVICVHHNVESELLRRRASTARGVMKWYLALQANLTEKEERRWAPLVQLNIAVSDNDCRKLQSIAPSARFTVVPNGVDAGHFQPHETAQRGIVFVGAYSWQPNRDAMEYFCSAVLPLVRSSRSDVAVTWVGRASDAVRSELAERYGIRLTGYVEDIRPYVAEASCYIAPLRAGGGTRLKILDAWAMGKAVVSTSVGCEGLDARHEQNILIGDTPSAFATAVLRVLSDPETRNRLGREARRTVEKTYDWEVIGRSMLDRYRAAVETSVPQNRSPRATARNSL